MPNAAEELNKKGHETIPLDLPARKGLMPLAKVSVIRQVGEEKDTAITNP